MSPSLYLNHCVPDADHVLGQVLRQAEEASLGVEPGVGAELLVVWLQGLDHHYHHHYHHHHHHYLDHPADAELVVPLHARVKYSSLASCGGVKIRSFGRKLGKMRQKINYLYRFSLFNNEGFLSLS